MSSYNRRLFLLSAVALGGCGFSPSYGPSGGARGLLNQVVIDAPDNKYTYVLVRELEDRLGRTQSGKYALGLSLSTERKGMALTIDGQTNRYDILAEVTYALRDTATGKVITTGKVDNFAGYSTTGSTVATIASEANAEERLMTILADSIHTDLLAYAAKNSL